MTAIHEDQPLDGFYKMRDGDRWLPVAIFQNAGQQIALVGKLADQDRRDPLAIWLWCAKHPIDREECKAWMQTGRAPGDVPQVDLPATVAVDNAPELGHVETPRHGDNGAPADPFEELEREVDEEHERVQAWIATAPTGKLACDQAANWLEKLRKLKAKVFDGFDAEKEEVRKEGQRIDTKWRGIKLTANASTTCLQSYFDEIGRAEQKRLQAEADAKAQAEAVQQAEAAAEMAAQQGMEAPALDVESVKADPVKFNAGGLRGSKIAPRKAKPTADITDWKLAVAHYSENAEIRKLVQRLANADAAHGEEVPGSVINLNQ